ncbi:EcoRII N-terminal effector-binding domain-containing protein [Pontibacillus sp. HMF3514]|uniref:EcoRII N-terminal effector-binding domain-containing protein n=1 Tax=Pontibacillus sp. HMF3514 TaxID=2692425 RepID=UPI00131FA7ED|nr:EcoRII N-terminal effector-binding domain-containing protein [Pontibacillus sp. HMF3514]QHE51677.1 hypothetical protein GS400_06340 [Pontibacillus sp. HMF3514]
MIVIKTYKNYKLQIISKILSPNDTGETGGHQAGILIPKSNQVINFFPNLGNDKKNPRVKLRFYDDYGDYWDFMFIHYNNKFFEGTRDEYRLTGMTSFIKQNNLTSGDEIFLSRDNDQLHLSYKQSSNEDSQTIMKLSKSWKVIKL